MSELNSGAKTGADVAFGFVFSTEFINRETTNEDYLTVLYRAFFNREPDTGGYNYWLAQLDSGADREDVLNGFIYATEFANLCFVYGISASDVSAFVRRFYQQCLDREPDETGLNGWVIELNSGTKTGADVANGFVFSEEFTALNTTNEEYLTVLYQAFFNRDPDPGGYSGWLALLNSGTPRQAILNGFTGSPEFANLCNSYGIIAIRRVGPYSITGNIQKGPFISGSSITIQELDDNLDPTGISYQTTTSDDFGTFSLGSHIVSRYVEVIATGFYFDEVAGSLSAANITLRAISDLSISEDVNVNILTTLEKDRIKYLIVNEGLTFTAARTQAEAEVLSIFNISGDNISTFDQMDISQDGNSNAILLAISVVLQGDNTVAELSELTSKINLDIKEDGNLDSSTFIDEIRNNGINLFMDAVRFNLDNRYESLGLTVTIPRFEDYVDSDGDGTINVNDDDIVTRTLWTKIFGGSSNDVGGSVQQDTINGGFIIAGSTQSFNGGEDCSFPWPCSDVWLIKTDSNGNEEWNKTFGGGGHDNVSYGGESIQQTTDGGYIVVGNTTSFGNGYFDIWLLKIDSNGNEQWNKTFGTSHGDYGYSVQQTDDGGYIVLGNTDAGADQDAWLIKTDANGNEQWNKYFGGSSGDRGYSLQKTTGGGFIIVGYTESYSNGENDVWLIKTDGNGNEEWSRSFGGSSYEAGRSVQQTLDGGYIITGYKKFSSNDDKVWLIKTDSNGNEEWNQTFGGGSGNCGGYSVQQTIDTGYIITGTTGSSWNAEPDIWLIKTDSQGNEEWNQTFGGVGNDWGYSVRQTSVGDYVIVGWTNSFGNGGTDVWLIRVAH